MEIKIAYRVKSFWSAGGHTGEFIIDKYHGTDYETAIKKAFAAMRKDNVYTLYIDNIVFMYDSYADFENGIIQMSTWEAANSCDHVKMAFSKAKKEALRIVQEYG